jgi:two-component system alkaline phosphatase synthesis response regulator PhoP
MAQNKKILIIDDDPDDVELIKMALGKEPYDLVFAWNGKEGVEKAKSEKPDAIILDIMMPEKDGFWACKQIKKDPELENIPVLALTAVSQHFSDTSYAKGERLSLESDDYIEKPIDEEYLKKRLEKYLKK